MTWHRVIIMVLTKFMVTKHWQKWMDMNSIITKVCKRLEEPQQSNFHNFGGHLQYAHLFCGMNACIMSKDLKDQITWLNWWDKRKYFIFKVFVSIDDPPSILAKVLHARWKNSHAKVILRCAHEGIKCSLYTKQWMKDLRSDEYIFGYKQKNTRFS